MDKVTMTRQELMVTRAMSALAGATFMGIFVATLVAWGRL